MTTDIQLLRSQIAHKRPLPSNLLDGQVALNFAPVDPGMYFRAGTSGLVKVGPTAVTNNAMAPNQNAVGFVGYSIGEDWLDQRSEFSSGVHKVWDGSRWVPSNGFTVDHTNGNFKFGRTMSIRSLVVDGTKENGWLQFPSGPDTDEDMITASAGMMRFSTSRREMRIFDGIKWRTLGASEGGAIETDSAIVNLDLTVFGSTILGNDCREDAVVINGQLSVNCNAEIGVDGANELNVRSQTYFANGLNVLNQTRLTLSCDTKNSAGVYLVAPSNTADGSDVGWTLPREQGLSNSLMTVDSVGQLSWTRTPNLENVTATNVTTTANVTVGNRLSVSNNVTIGGALTVDESAIFNNDATFQGSIIFAGDGAIFAEEKQVTVQTLTANARVTTQDLYANGSVILGNGAPDTITMAAPIALGGSILPFEDNAYSIGNNLNRLEEIHSTKFSFGSDRHLEFDLTQNQLRFYNGVEGKTYTVVLQEVV